LPYSLGVEEAQDSYLITRLKGSIIVPPEGDLPELERAADGTPVTLLLDGRLVRPDGAVGIEVLNIEGYLDEQPWFIFPRPKGRGRRQQLTLVAKLARFTDGRRVREVALRWETGSAHT
jgi:hypothetical protein